MTHLRHSMRIIFTRHRLQNNVKTLRLKPVHSQYPEDDIHAVV